MLSQKATWTRKQAGVPANVNVANPKRTDDTEEPTNLLFFDEFISVYLYFMPHLRSVIKSYSLF